MPPSHQGLFQRPSADPAHQVIYGGEYGPQPFYWSPSDGIIIRGARPPSGRGVLSSHRPAGLCAAAPDDDQRTAALPMTFRQHHPSDDVDMMVERSVVLPSFQGIEPSVPAWTSSSFIAAWPSDVLATSAAHQSAAPPAALPPSSHHQSSSSEHLPCTLGFSSCANSGMAAAQHVDSSGLFGIASMSLVTQSAPSLAPFESATPQQQQQQYAEPSLLPTRGHSSIFVSDRNGLAVPPTARRPGPFSMTSTVQSRSGRVLRPVPFWLWEEPEARETASAAAAAPKPPAVVSTGGPPFGVAGSSFRRTISSRATEETPIGAEGGVPPQTDKMSLLLDAAVVFMSMEDKPKPQQPIKCQCCKKPFPASTQKTYLRKTRICSVCCTASVVLKNGNWVRYCQLCKWTHSLEKFIGEKRSCEAVLERHNKSREEKRAREKEKGSAAANARAPTATPASHNTKKKARQA